MKKTTTLLLLISLTITSYSQQLTNLIVTNINANDVTLNWDSASCTNNSYSLSYKLSTSSIWITPISVPDSIGTISYNIDNLSQATTYNWRVKCSADSLWTNGVDFTTTSSTCNKSLDQHLNGFNPDPVYGLWVWSFDTLSITNTSNCDLRIRPEFEISHDSLSIGANDFDLKWFNPYIGNWPDIPYSINANGNAAGFWGFGSDSTGTQISQGTEQQIIIKIRFRTNANIGTYSAEWITQEVDSSGNFLQTLSDEDSSSISLADCSVFSIDSSYSSNISCFNDNNGSAGIILIQNGSNEYLYNWSNGDTTSISSNLQVGNYYCIVTDKNWQQCSDSIGFTISEPNELTSSYTQTNVSCYDANDGGAIVNFFGGSSGSIIGDTNYILGWAGASQPVYLPYPQTVFNTSLLPAPYNAVPAGIYPYTVTDLNNCTIYDTITITEPDSLYINYISSNYNGYSVACFGDNNASIDIQIIGGTAPFENYLNSTLQLGLNSNTLSAGNYTNSIIDVNGCNVNTNINLNEPSQLITTLNAVAISCYGLCDGEIYSSISGGLAPYYYLWTNGQNTSDISNLCSANYALTLTDENGCTENTLETINMPNDISISVDSILNISTYSGNDGFIYITASGGSGSLNTNWTSANNYSSNNNDILNLYADIYYLEVIDSNLCSYSDTFELFQPSSLWLSIDAVVSPNCYDSCNGAINISAQGGDSTYTYSWSGPNGFTSINNDINNLCDGEYIILIDDGITVLIDTVNIYQPQPLTTLLSVDSIVCHNGTSQAQINVWGGSQPLTYSWSNGDANYYTTVSSGNYSIDVSDINGCSYSESFSLSNPDSIFTQTSNTNISCFGGNNGSISINISNGGMPPYNFSNNNGVNYQASNTFNNLVSGNYSFLISDNNGCLGSALAELIEPLAITSSTSATDVSCYGYCDGSVSVTALGGTTPYYYNWPNGTSNLCAGFYNVITTDVNGCINSNSVVVNEPNPLIINVSIVGNTIVATSGFTSYQWYDNYNNQIIGATDSIFNPPGMASYYVSVSDINGCLNSSYSIEYTISSIENYSSSVNIFPNPTNGNITVISGYNIESIKLYNTIGNELYLVNNKENKITETKLDLSTFAKGVYFIKININNQIINQRIILQ